MKRVLLLGQGDGRRWNDSDGNPHGGQPKHFAQVMGERVAERGVRLFQERGCEVFLVAPDWYPDMGADRHVTLERSKLFGHSMDKLIAPKAYWSADDVTVVAYADCFYTEEAASLIAEHDTRGVHYFRRPWASELTGHRWDELFATAFSADAHEVVERCANMVHGWVGLGLVRAQKVHMYHHYTAYLGRRRPLPPSKLQHTPDQTVIDDWTDDFDHPREYAEWIRRRVEAGLGV